MKKLLLILPAMAAALSAQAEITPDKIYADHMVLQQGARVPITGTCTGRGAVNVSFAGQTVQAQVRGNRWRAMLEPMPASAESRTITITQGNDKMEIKDVLVGEVWISSGQSNMLWRLNQTRDTNTLNEADTPLFRFYHSEPQVHTNAVAYGEREQEILKNNEMYTGSWSCNTRQSRQRMSAVGYYFGRELSKQLGTPVAVVHASLGGSEMMAWMPPAVLRAKYRECTNSRWLESRYMSAWVRGRARQNIGRDLNAPHPYKPAYLFETGIAPWVNFPVAGVIWYQGESDAEIQDMEQNYNLLKDLITGWRAAFRNENLPFLQVQLPRINDRSALRAYWPEFRTVQQWAQDRMPGVYSLTTIDLGSTNSDVHPPRKLEVGTRLAHLAAARVYSKDVPFSGPVVREAKAEGSSITLSYDHAEGLTTTNGQAPVGFELSANGREYHPATARIEGNTIILSSDAVRAPKHARYAWATYMQPNLVNSAGLPAVPYAPTAR